MDCSACFVKFDGDHGIPSHTLFDIQQVTIKNSPVW